MQRTELELQAGPAGWVAAFVLRDGGLAEVVFLRLAPGGDDGIWAPEGTLYVPSLTPEKLRTIPLRRILAAVAASEALRNDLGARLDEPTPEPGPAGFLEPFSGLVHPEPPPLGVLKRPPGRRLTDDFYAAVAEKYRTATTRGLNPRAAIAEAAGTSTDVAGRWVREARKRRYLPPTTPGKVKA